MDVHKEETQFSSQRKIQLLIKVYLLICIASAVYYFSYLFNPENISSIWLYIPLVFAEIYLFFFNVGVWYTMLFADHDPRSHDYYDWRKGLIENGKVDGKVAALVTYHSEDYEVLKNTLIAVKNMYIEHETYLSDDFGDEERPHIKALCEEVGVHYLKTQGNTQKKIGSLNYAYSKIRAKYIANFDADFMPHKNFLIETLPFFNEKEVAFVQTPQYCYNQVNLISKGYSDAVLLFYDYIMPAKNAFNAAFWVGTNTVFRKEAIKKLGGFPYHSCDDVNTAYTLHQNGWKSIFLPKVLAQGLAPESLEAFFSQQTRWAQSSLDMFFRNNVAGKKLTIDQKFQYFHNFSFYLGGIVILIMLLMPIFFMLTGLRPLNSDGTEWAIHYLPYFFSQFIAIFVLVNKVSLESVIVSMNAFPTYIRALIGSLRNKPVKWKITNAKGDKADREVPKTFRYLYWHFFLIFLTIIAIPVAVINIREQGSVILSIGWGVINMFIIGSFAYTCLKDAAKEDRKTALEELKESKKSLKINLNLNSPKSK